MSLPPCRQDREWYYIIITSHHGHFTSWTSWTEKTEISPILKFSTGAISSAHHSHRFLLGFLKELMLPSVIVLRLTSHCSDIFPVAPLFYKRFPVPDHNGCSDIAMAQCLCHRFLGLIYIVWDKPWHMAHNSGHLSLMYSIEWQYSWPTSIVKQQCCLSIYIYIARISPQQPC